MESATFEFDFFKPQIRNLYHFKGITTLTQKFRNPPHKFDAPAHFFPQNSDFIACVKFRFFFACICFIKNAKNAKIKSC